MKNLLIIDNRERKLAKELKKREIIFEIQVLPIGDMVIFEGDTVIERKEINDFFGSQGAHLTNQYMDMFQYPQKHLIIEGSFNQLNSFEKVKIPHYAGMLARLARQNITVTQVPDMATFINVSLAILDKSKKLPSDFRIIKRKKNTVQEIVRAAAPRIKQSDIEKLLEKYGSPLNIALVPQKELTKIKGIGPKIAERLYKNFRNIKDD